MNDPPLMRGSETMGDLDCFGHCLVDGNAAGVQLLTKSLAGQQLRDYVRRTVVADVEHRQNVGMIQRRGGARFPLEARESLGIARERARQDLDGDVSAEARIAGLVDLAHAAGAQRRQDLVRAESGSRRKPHRTGGIVALLRGATGGTGDRQWHVS